jgi:multiple sugar transport system ATP-binding protein
VYVTHDQVEAMTLGQRVAVLRDGVLQQCDTPQTLFRRPVNLFVAAFIGSPSMNFVSAVVERGEVRFAGLTLAGATGVRDGQVILGLRPTAFAPGRRDGWRTLTVTPDVVEDLGDERYLIFEVDAPRVDTDAVRAAFDARSADEVTLLASDARARFTARVPADVPATIGAPVTLSVDPSRLYFFDPATGAALG